MTELKFVSRKKLAWVLGYPEDMILRVAAHAGSLYEPFDVPKKSGEGRHIDHPVGELAELQRAISRRILREVEVPATMFGGVRGRSCRDAAEPHVGAPVLVTIDLRNCFPQISDRAVFRAFRNVVGCNDEIAGLLTKLTTIQHRLPQGSSTSSALANLALLPLHDEVLAITKAMGLELSFFCDDIAISGPRARDCIRDVVAAVQLHGHAIRHSKLKVMGEESRRSLLGITVNRKLSAGRARIVGVRRAIHLLAQEPTVNERQIQSIMGKIGHVRWIDERQGEALARRMQKLLTDRQVTKGGSRDAVPEFVRCRYRHRHRRSPSPRPQTQPCGLVPVER